MVRALMPRALGATEVLGWRSTTTCPTPCWERAIEVVKPTGPAPTTTTSVSNMGASLLSRNTSLLTSTLRFEIRGDFVIGSSRKERVSILKTNGSTFDIDFVKIPRHLHSSELDLIPFNMNGLNLSRLPAPRTSNHMSDAIALEQSAATTPSDFNMPDIPASLRALMAEFGPKMARRHRRSRRHDDHCVLGSLETDFPR